MDAPRNVDKIVTKTLKNKAKEDKLVLVDFYTGWCGWCKKLDVETYKDPEVVALMNKYFYPVKFDAEQKTIMSFANKMYRFDATAGRGTNGFALEMATRRAADSVIQPSRSWDPWEKNCRGSGI